MGEYQISTAAIGFSSLGISRFSLTSVTLSVLQRLVCVFNIWISFYSTFQLLKCKHFRKCEILDAAIIIKDIFPQFQINSGLYPCLNIISFLGEGYF
jgi:hypothetical protein